MSKNKNIQQGYKQTDLGVLPKDWEVVRLGEIFNISSGATPLRQNKLFWENPTIQWVKIGDLNNSFIISTEEKISLLALEKTTCKLLPKYTLLIAMYGGFNQIGRTGILSIEATTNQAISALIPKDDKISPIFVNACLLLHKEKWKEFAISSRKDPNITKADIEKFKIPLPPLVEQEKIAQILSAWDNGISTLDNLIKAKERYKKALMQRLLTPPCEVKSGTSPLPCGEDLGVGANPQDRAKFTLSSFNTTHPLAPSAREGGQKGDNSVKEVDTAEKVSAKKQENCHDTKAPPLAGGVGVGDSHANDNHNDKSPTLSLRASKTSVAIYNKSVDCHENPTDFLAMTGSMDCHSPNGLRNDDKILDCHDLTASNLAMTEKNSKSLRFAEFTDKWQEFRLGDICEIKKGEQLNKLTLSDDTKGKFAVINGGILPSGYTDKFNSHENTITISEGGNSCGFVNLIREKFWSGGHCYTIVESKANTLYLYYFLKFKEKFIQELRVGSGLPNIQKKDIEKFKIFLPALTEQKKIAQILSICDKEIDTLKSKLQCLKTQKKGLMQQLLSAKVRVKC